MAERSWSSPTRPSAAQAARAIRERAPARATRAFVIVRAADARPSHGNVIYDEAVHDAAQVRIDLARAFLRERGHRGRRRGRRPGPVHTPRWTRSPSTGPTRSSSRRCRPTASGWLRRDLRRAHRARRPACRSTHVVVDIDERGPAVRRDAGASPTGRRRASELIERLKAARPRTSPHLFIVVVPAGAAATAHAARAGPRAAQRSCSTRCATPGMVAAGMIGDPDPYTAVDERAAVLPHRRHRHLDAARDALGLAARPTSSSASRSARPSRSSTSSRRRRAAGRAERLMEAASIAAAPRPRTTTTTGRPRPTAPRAWSPQLLGMLLFIISRDHGLRGLLHGLLLHPGRGGRPVAGARAPSSRSSIAGVNTRDPAVLVVHACTGRSSRVKRGNRFGLQGGHLSRPSCWARRSCSSRSTSTSTSASRRRTARRVGLLRPDRPARRARRSSA